VNSFLGVVICYVDVHLVAMVLVDYFEYHPKVRVLVSSLDVADLRADADDLHQVCFTWTIVKRTSHSRHS